VLLDEVGILNAGCSRRVIVLLNEVDIPDCLTESLQGNKGRYSRARYSNYYFEGKEVEILGIR
jgi:hypothetical protein